MLKYCEYWSKSGNKTIEHGVTHKSRLEYCVADDCTLTVNLITDEVYASLIDKWLGSSVEPAPEAPAKAGKSA